MRANCIVPAWLLALLVCGAMPAGCAKRLPPSGPARSPADEFALGEGLLRQGCYRCLEQAQATFARLEGRPRARARAFEAAALLAVRDRELGLRKEDHLPLARRLAPAPVSPRSALVLAIIEALPWPAAACGSAERDAAIASGSSPEPEMAERARLLFAAASDDLLLRYLRLSVRCMWPAIGGDSPEAEGGPTDPPLLRYRTLLCARVNAEGLTALQLEVPRFTEIDLPLGDAAMAGGALLTAERHYTRAFKEFPSMLPAAHGLARVHVMLEEYEASLPEYDVMLTTVPDQQDALLGKARALSQLGRHHEALQLLDRLVALGTWLLGDAHYWRGWNLLQLGAVESAAVSADAALRLMVNARVHVLAGATAAARLDWDRAAVEFETALPLDETDCDIPLSLGTVRGRRREWAAAADRFARAAVCLLDTRGRLDRRLAEIAAADMSGERRARFEARTRAAVDRARTQEGLARFNAAVALANAGRRAEAVPWAREASAWPEWRVRALDVLRELEPSTLIQVP